MIKVLTEHEISAICEDAPELIEEENAIGSSDSGHDRLLSGKLLCFRN